MSDGTECMVAWACAGSDVLGFFGAALDFLLFLAALAFAVWLVRWITRPRIDGASTWDDILEHAGLDTPKRRRKRVERRFLKLRNSTYEARTTERSRLEKQPRVRIERKPKDPTGGIRP